VNYFIEKVGR